MLEDNMSSELAAKLTKEKKFFEKKKEKDS